MPRSLFRGEEVLACPMAWDGIDARWGLGLGWDMVVDPPGNHCRRPQPAGRRRPRPATTVFPTVISGVDSGDPREGRAHQFFGFQWDVVVAPRATTGGGPSVTTVIDHCFPAVISGGDFKRPDMASKRRNRILTLGFLTGCGCRSVCNHRLVKPLLGSAAYPAVIFSCDFGDPFR